MKGRRETEWRTREVVKKRGMDKYKNERARKERDGGKLYFRFNFPTAGRE